jgi:AcrR family transcriptional regulator
MARYAKDHKQATRRRIIGAAGRRLKRDGIDGSGVAALMADAGLTNGAFYAHFDSKEDLVASAVADQLHEQREAYSTQSLEEIVRGYLSIEHRDDREGGCPSAALLDEIARSADPVKRAYTAGQRSSMTCRPVSARHLSARSDTGRLRLMVGRPGVPRPRRPSSPTRCSRKASRTP